MRRCQNEYGRQAEDQGGLGEVGAGTACRSANQSFKSVINPRDDEHGRGRNAVCSIDGRELDEHPQGNAHRRQADEHQVSVLAFDEPDAANNRGYSQQKEPERLGLYGGSSRHRLPP